MLRCSGASAKTLLLVYLKCLANLQEEVLILFFFESSRMKSATPYGVQNTRHAWPCSIVAAMSHNHLEEPPDPTPKKPYPFCDKPLEPAQIGV
jgi:hypothetical protein